MTLYAEPGAPSSVPARHARAGRRAGTPSKHEPAAARRAVRGGRRTRRSRIAYAYLAPALLIYIAFVALPWLHTIQLSFFHWDGVTQGTWAGLSNYREVLSDPALRASVLHALGFIVFYSVLPVTFALVLAAVIGGRGRRSHPIARTVLFLPQIVPLVAVGVIWRWMYAEDGVINQALRGVGLGSVARAWLGDFTWAYVAVGLVGTWVMLGLCLVIFQAGIQKIDSSLYEAARMDGAGPVREFFAVTLPGLRAEIGVAMTVTVIAALASFDVVYVTTGGGPGDSTTVPGVLIYRLAFTSGEVGMACALAVVLSLLISLVVLAIGRVIREKP